MEGHRVPMQEQTPLGVRSVCFLPTLGIMTMNGLDIQPLPTGKTPDRETDPEASGILPSPVEAHVTL